VKTLPAANLQGLAEDVLLCQFAPPAVLVDAAGDILYVSGHTGDYLEPAAGKADWNIHAMARDGLRQHLAMAIRDAVRGRKSVTLRGITITAPKGPKAPKAPKGHSPGVDIVLHRLESPPALCGKVMIVFSHAAPVPSAQRIRGGAPAAVRAAQAESARELRETRARLQAFGDEMQAFQEELKSANEELQSTNEELQSTNEELTTSKEEMQSLNEELQTVNAELQGKLDDLSIANNDLSNLLNSTDIAIIFLDGALRVRRFTEPVTRIFKLLPGDVGRALSDIVSDLNYPALHDDAREVLRTLMFSEKPITAGGGRWFLIRIMPYRTVANVIDGVVITFADITVAKQLEAELRKVRQTVVSPGKDPA
jgi:two-component system, chemotaxis family, CheB/CheR fusion protein